MARVDWPSPLRKERTHVAFEPSPGAILTVGIVVYVLLAPVMLFAPTTSEKAIALIAYLALPALFWIFGHPTTARRPALHSPQLGSPPVPWISALAWNARREPQRSSGWRDANGPGTLEDAELWALQPIEPELASTLSSSLRATPAIGAFWQTPEWPVCCGQLSVLALANPTREELASLEQATGRWDDVPISPASARADWKSELSAIRSGGAAENGVNMFLCGKCGGSTAVYSHS